MDEKTTQKTETTDLPEMLETWPISLCSSDETHEVTALTAPHWGR